MNSSRALAAGLLGTAAMTALLMIEPSVGLPEIAIGQILSTSLGLTSAFSATGPALGWVMHFVVGMVLAVVYAVAFARRLPGPALMKGALFGALVFVVAQATFLPLVGGGFFSGGDVDMLAGSLLGHLVYGATMGWIYGGIAAPE